MASLFKKAPDSKSFFRVVSILVKTRAEPIFNYVRFLKRRGRNCTYRTNKRMYAYEIPSLALLLLIQSHIATYTFLSVALTLARVRSTYRA